MFDRNGCAHGFCVLEHSDKCSFKCQSAAKRGFVSRFEYDKSLSGGNQLSGWKLKKAEGVSRARFFNLPLS